MRAPVVALIALSWYPSELPSPGSSTVVGVIDTYASAGRLPGANVSVAAPEVSVPPAVAEIRVAPAGAVFRVALAGAVFRVAPAGGGPRPLPGVAAGSFGVGSMPVRLLAPSEGGGVSPSAPAALATPPPPDVPAPATPVGAAAPRSLTAPAAPEANGAGAGFDCAATLAGRVAADGERSAKVAAEVAAGAVSVELVTGTATLLVTAIWLTLAAIGLTLGAARPAVAVVT